MWLMPCICMLQSQSLVTHVYRSIVSGHVQGTSRNSLQLMTRLACICSDYVIVPLQWPALVLLVLHACFVPAAHSVTCFGPTGTYLGIVAWNKVGWLCGSHLMSHL